MTVQQAMARWGCGETMVRNALRQGLVPGAHRPSNGKSSPWVIPDDAPNPIPNMRKRKPMDDTRYHVAYVQANSGLKSIREIANNLGITPDDVRRIYDTIFAEEAAADG